jgi:hypothetical protein
MKSLGRLAGLFVLTLILGSFTPQPAAGSWADTLGGSSTASTGGGGATVPIPGTFMLLAGGLAGLAWWRAKYPRD